MKKMENQNQMNNDNDEVEIDLLELLLAMKKKLWAIILAAVVCGGIAGVYSKLVLTPQYTSTAMMYILSKETTLTSLADLQIGSQLTADYKVILSSRPVLTSVISENHLDMTYEQLKSKITTDNPSDTRILTVTVTDPDPVLAKQLADSIASTSSEYIGDIMEMVPPKIIEKGTIADYPTSPNNKKNAMLGAVAGIVIACGVIVLTVLMNDTIRSEEDVERYLGLTILASIPDWENAGSGKKYGYYGKYEREENGGKK